MGGEKFFNIKCLYSGLRPSCAVIVCTVRALKLHSCLAPKVGLPQDCHPPAPGISLLSEVTPRLSSPPPAHGFAFRAK
eukprot:scaffold35112_cov39-Isochrysis_galbana.AAC.1